MKDSIVIRLKRNRFNPVAKDLRTSKYRMRVASSKKQYNRSEEKRKALDELNYA